MSNVLRIKVKITIVAKIKIKKRTKWIIKSLK